MNGNSVLVSHLGRAVASPDANTILDRLRLIGNNTLWTPSLKSDVTLNDSDKTFVVTTGERWWVKSIYVDYTSTEPVGNRQVTVRFTDGTNVIGEIYAGAVQAQSLSRLYTFAPGLADLTGFRHTSFLTTPLPQDLILLASFGIRVFDAAAIAAATDDMLVRMLIATQAV